MTDKFRCDRLEKLAHYLATVPPERSDTGTWKVTKDQIETGDTTVTTACGFAGCAIGWAIHGRLFPELRWNKRTFVERHFGYAQHPVLVGRGVTDYEAIAQVFGITTREAEE